MSIPPLLFLGYLLGITGYFILIVSVMLSLILIGMKVYRRWWSN